MSLLLQQINLIDLFVVLINGGHMMGEYGGIVNEHEVLDVIRKNNISCTPTTR